MGRMDSHWTATPGKRPTRKERLDTWRLSLKKQQEPSLVLPEPGLDQATSFPKLRQWAGPVSDHAKDAVINGPDINCHNLNIPSAGAFTSSTVTNSGVINRIRNTLQTSNPWARQRTSRDTLVGSCPTASLLREQRPVDSSYVYV